MTFRSLITFLNPSENLYKLSPYFQKYLQSTPLTPLTDVLSALLTLILLIFEGLPTRYAIRTLPHLLCRRQENYADKLHSHGKVARLRSLFSLLWTNGLISLGIHAAIRDILGYSFWNYRFANPFDELVFWLNFIFLIPLLAPRFKETPKLGNHWARMEDFNRLIESRSISPALVDRIYLWTGNVAIWFHCLILLCPFKTLVINILTLYHPLDTIRWYIGSNTRILFIVIISFLICTLLFLALLKAGERLIYSHHYRPYGSNLETWQIFCAGVSALCFGGLLKWFGLKNCTITVWVVSDAVLWVGLEAYVAWAIMMSEGAFGTYLRQRAYERATARKEEEGRGTSSIAQ